MKALLEIIDLITFPVCVSSSTNLPLKHMLAITGKSEQMDCAASSLESLESADFHSEGRRPWPSEVLNNAQRLGAICWLHSFKRRAGTPSGPHAFEIDIESGLDFPI